MDKILVIEDETFVRDSVKELLEIKGYKVFTADNGNDGLSLSQEILPDVIVCDIMMNGLDGYGVLKKLMQDKETSPIPFIFLSAKAEMADLRHGMNLGADDYLVKPFKAADLFKAIETRLHKRKSETIEKGGKPAQDSNKTIINDHLFVVDGNKPQFLNINSIVCITAFGEYTNVYTTGTKKLVVRKYLKEWESTLPTTKFIRIHRSTLINLDYVDRVEKFYNRALVVYLKNQKQPFMISQRYYKKLKKYLFF
jgi:DNA-binding LytR/AlgR family response regulator